MRRITCMLVAVLVTAACEMPIEFVSQQQPQLALHGVLDGHLGVLNPNQFIVLERTHAGQSYVLRPDLPPSDLPISDDGIPEIDATVTLEAPDGQVYVGREPITSTGRQAGKYVFPLTGSSIIGGGLYKLSITTTQGEVLTAETRVPARTTPAANPTRTFDRVLDTLELQWNAVPGARAYAVRISGPWGPFIMMTDETKLRLTGQLRNLDGDGIPRVFLPGFQHSVTVAAVDSGWYDYYRTSNDATGRGIASNVRGGHGFLGSVMMVHTETFDVTSPAIEPVDGTFDRIIDPTTANYWAREITLRLESKGARADQGDALTGNYRLTPTGPLMRILGTKLRDSVKLVFLGGTGMASDTADNFTAIWRGRLRGDTLDGRFHKGATGKFLKR